jgi:hypothetical protein
MIFELSMTKLLILRAKSSEFVPGTGNPGALAQKGRFQEAEIASKDNNPRGINPSVRALILD